MGTWVGFFRSSSRFIWRVTKRSWGAIVLWIIDLSEFYSQFVAKWIGSDWKNFLDPFVSTASKYTLHAIGIIVLAAILYTFYEVDREVHRNPKIGKSLKQFYGRSGEMLHRAISNNEELVLLRGDGATWYSEAKAWIKENMEPASLKRFQKFQHSLPYNHGSTLNDEHQKLLNGISIYHVNIQALIEHDEWR
ncbi:hypothetical protein MYX64_09905 [Nitrospinae bacterium AH_259_B05_G02_I21]|nr:hypothetical protein [Nitrospinae bacterium AH_259_B05_G02_I21]MDA2932682.1 hypothetical protein [Nitrospinae bacterium AH-259-F20]